jgi:hypothetical protein
VRFRGPDGTGLVLANCETSFAATARPCFGCTAGDRAALRKLGQPEIRAEGRFAFTTWP